MCGFAGWITRGGLPPDPTVVESMAHLISHRGRDSRGSFTDQREVAFAHRRLSIVDLGDSSRQPMADEGGSYVLLYNGEIYNFRELRTELEQMGHQFRSSGDTEVVLRAFEQWNVGCFRRLMGMFAIAIWCQRERTLILARDAVGMKPLYYAEVPGDRGIAFASEVKAFLSLPGFEARINEGSLRQYLEFGYVWDTHATALNGVVKVPPGSLVRIRNGKSEEPEVWFSPPVAATQPDRSISERSEELYERMSVVVGEHLHADVPVGILLSGGIDSGVIAALASQHSRPITFTFAFEQSEIDEREQARRVAKAIGSEHHEVVITPSQFYSRLQSDAWYLDDLFEDWGLFTTKMMYERCRQEGLKVVLVGEGSDEIFGGYPQFMLSRRHRWKEIFLFQLYRRYAGRRYGRQFPDFREVMKSHLKATAGDRFDAIRRFEVSNQLPNNYLMKVDKASMAAEIEARAPYMDRRIVEIVLRTPSKYLLSGSINKLLLRTMARQYRLVPEETVTRPKFGASVAASWISESQEFRQFARTIILEQGKWVDRIGAREAMRRFFDEQQSGYRFPHALAIFRNYAWRILLLELWSSRYLSDRGREVG